MTPLQKLKHAILVRATEMEGKIPSTEPITAENIDDIYEELDGGDWLQDARSEVRCTGTDTSLAPNYSRHYEAEAVAVKTPDGSWVGFTHYYGGGKHGEPEAMPWMEQAYDVTVVEEEKLVIVQTFSKATL